LDFDRLIEKRSIAQLMEEFPISGDFFRNANIPLTDTHKTLQEVLSTLDDEWFYEFGQNRFEVHNQLVDFLQDMTASENAQAIKSLTVIGGKNKRGEDENARFTLMPGDVVSVVGPTGSGKSRLLADIECLAQGDTPTRRHILVDGQPVTDDVRFALGGKLVAQLSQNMNFVMDLTVQEFLEMHAGSLGAGQGPLPMAGVVNACFEKANSLAGEKFTPGTKVTMLSGGQSRALMIADCAYMSQSPIVLIDEIENAGVDRRKAIDLLARREKIVLISTHDPLLALGATHRIVIKHGGIYRVLTTSPEEKSSMKELERVDAMLADARRKLRSGERIASL
jgi:ABC-type lipoprotein export system ATPase subunit